MFAFADQPSRKHQPALHHANISLLSITVSAQIFDNSNCIYYMQLIPSGIIKMICGWSLSECEYTVVQHDFVQLVDYFGQMLKNDV